MNPEFDEFLVVDEETPIYDSSSEEFGEIIGYAAAGSYLQYYSEGNDPNAPGVRLSITADPGTGYVLAEDAENWFSCSCTLTFDDLPGEVEQPEDWEADPEAWYPNAPAPNLPEYSDEIRELGWAVDQNTENRRQRFGQGAPVYASPGLDSELLGGLAHTASEEYWWGYLHESDFWMFWHQPTGAVGFVPGESYQGDEDLDDSEGVTDPPEGDDENGSSEEDGSSEEEGGADPEGEGSEDPSEPFGSFEADVTEVAPGDDITLTTTGLDAGESVEITLNPTLAEVEAEEDGEFTVTVTIPEDTEPGDYTITAQSLDREVSAEIDITVVEPIEPAGVGGAR